MKKYIFVGRILPERTYVSLPPLKSNVEGLDLPFKGSFSVQIAVGQLNVLLETDSELDIETLKNIVESFVYAYVDIFNYLEGRAYTVEITSVFIPDDDFYQVFGVEVKDLQNEKSSRPFSFIDTNKIVFSSSLSPLVLADMRSAIRNPLNMAFYCRRALETITRDISSNNNNKKRWEETYEQLNIDDSFAKEIKNLGGNVRHGKYASIDGDTRIRILKKTWSIFDRYLICLEKNKEKLDGKDYPLLKEKD